jgi:hypothetical protein
MTIFSPSHHPESRRPLALEQLVSIHTVTMDMRWAMVELAFRSLTAMCAQARSRIAGKARAPASPQGHEHCCC